MILKYKKLNSWTYKSIKDVTIAKVDLSNVVSKYINNITGKLEINLSNFSKAGDEVFGLINKSIDLGSYGYSVDTLSALMKNTYYVIVKEDDSDNNPIYIHTESYLMTDDGKTIERLM